MNSPTRSTAVSSLARRYQETGSEYMRERISEFMSERVCPTCQGKGETIVAIDLRESVPYTAEQIGNVIRLNFAASVIPPKPYESAEPHPAAAPPMPAASWRRPFAPARSGCWTCTRLRFPRRATTARVCQALRFGWFAVGPTTSSRDSTTAGCRRCSRERTSSLESRSP